MRLGMGLGLGNLLSGQPLTGFPNDFSFNFDGSNDYLDIGSVSLTGQFTVSFYCNINTSSQTEFVIGSTGSNKIGFLGGDVFVRAINGGSSDTSVSEPSSGSFHHIVVTRDSSNKVDLYLNGGSANRLFSDSAQSGTVTWNYVGRDSTTTQNFTGLIDEVAIWDTALSASDVAKLGSKPVDLTKYSASNLKLWLRSGDAVLPEEDKSIARSDFYTDFDGLDDHIELGSITSSNPLSLNGSHGSVIFWVNIPDVSAGDDHKRIIDKSDAGSAGKGYAITIRTDGSINAYIAGGSIIVSDAGEITDAEWFHIVWKWDGTNHKLYKNGIEIKSASSSTTPPSDTANMSIGSWNHDVARELNGSLSSVSVYQTALDNMTISKMASDGRFKPQRDNRFSVVDFDGVNDFIDIPDNDALDAGSGDMTITFWYNPLSMSANMEIIDKYDTSSNKGYRVRHHNATSKVLFNINDGADSDGYYSYIDVTLSYGQWYHVTIIWDNSEQQATYYINGVNYGRAFSTSLRSIGDTSNSVPLRFGGTQAGGSDYKGSISSIAIYNVARTSEEDYACYQKGITHNPSADTGLVGLWRMGDDTSAFYPTIADSSSNSNDGTASGAVETQQMVAGYDMGAFESSSEELYVEVNTVANATSPTNETNATTGWSAVSSTISSVAEGYIGSYSLKVVTSVNEGYAYSSGWTVDNDSIYKLSITWKTEGTETNEWRYGWGTSAGSGTYGTVALDGSTDWATSVQYIKTTSTSLHLFLQEQSSTSNALALYVDEISIKQVLQSADASDTFPIITDVNEPVLGAELLTNGTFDADSNWAKGDGWTIANGVASSDETAQSSGHPAITQSVSLTSGTLYKVTYDIVYNDSSGNFLVQIYGGGTLNGTARTSSGSFTDYFLATANHTTFSIRSSDGNATGTVDNVSLKEVFGNVGTMTNQDSADLVYSSVLPDQSFLTGVNSAYNFIDLDGADQYIDAGALDSALEPPLSISMWVKGNAQTSSTLIQDDSIHSGLLYLRGGSEIAFYSASGEKSYSYTLNNTWVNIVMTQASSAKPLVYVNGSLLSNGTQDNTPNPSFSNIRIGGDNVEFEGSIGQTAIWNKELSSTEVGAIYTLGRHGNLLDSYSDNLKGYWAMSALDASTGLSDSISTIYDRSGNSNHGNPQNADAGDLASSPNAEPNGYSKSETNRSTTKP